MIKSLFDHDDEPKPPAPAQEDAETEESIRRELEDLNLTDSARRTEPVSEQEVRQIFSKIIELPPPAPNAETKIVEEPREEFSASVEPLPELKSSEPLPPTVETPYPNHESRAATPLDQIFSGYAANETEAPTPPAAEKTQTSASEPEMPSLFQNSEPESLSAAETLRQSGLAWSAAVGLFGSVVFMLILGWIFDTLTGASPYGIIAGIIIGAGIGFYQFFRVTSQIFKK